MPGTAESSSSESVTPPPRKRPAPQPETTGKKPRLGQQAPVTPPKAAPQTPPKAAAPMPVPAPPGDPVFILPELPENLNPPMEEVVWDKLATVHGKYAQAPTKIFENNVGGQIWLSGLPSAATRERFPSATLQIACFTERPEARGGIVLPNALLRRFPIAVGVERTDSWKEIWPLLLQTLYCGETVVVHCVAGRHRAGGASAVMRAALMDESFEVASRWISARRNTDIPGFCKDKAVAQWCQETVVATKRRDRWPKPTGYLAT